jgi:hypothetical protein
MVFIGNAVFDGYGRESFKDAGFARRFPKLFTPVYDSSSAIPGLMEIGTQRRSRSPDGDFLAQASLRALEANQSGKGLPALSTLFSRRPKRAV